MKYFLAVLATLFIGFIIFSITPFGYEFLGKAYKNADYNIYKENYAYKDGKVQHIKRLQLEMERETDPKVKQAIQGYIDEEQ